MKRKLLSLLVLLTVAATGARADYGWYDGSMSIGGVTTDCTAWSTSGDSPTNLGYVTDMTISSIAFNVWSDGNDRGGANMYFRIWDGGNEQVGSDQNLHLGESTRIEGRTHDFSISWSGTLDLAAAVGLTLEPGKTYYIDMYAKTYGNNRDEWYSGVDSKNYHAQLTILHSITFATGSGGTGWAINNEAKATAAAGSTVTVSYDDSTDGHKVKSVKYNGTDASGSGNTRTFTMPASNVEVSTELYYKLSETATDNETNYGSKTNVFLDRTLKHSGWNTFCAPFAIADPASVFGEGVKVRAFNSSSLSGNTLTLNFEDATSISAGTPYLIKLPGTSDVVLNNKMFERVTQNWTPVNVNPDEGIVTFKAVLVPTALTGEDKTVLFVTGGNELTYPADNGNINAFRAYFKLADDYEVEPGGGGVREFIMKFEDEETSIRSIENGQLIIDNEGFYRLDGTRVNGKLPKGIYIHNGRKEVMK